MKPTRYILVGSALFPTSDTDIVLSPAGAAAAAAQDVDVRRARADGRSHVGHGQVGDRDPGCRRAGWGTILVVLLDHNAIFADVAECDVLVRDATYGASCAVDGLDADAVLRVGDGRGFDEDVGNGVVGVAADGANG